MLPRLFVAEHNMENLDFSEEEIQEQLAILGYKNIPKHRLREFKRDLDELIRCGDWKTLASPTLTNSPTSTPQPSPPAYTKEKISQCSIKDSGEGFFLHPPKDSNRQVLPAWQSTSWQQGSNDSYAEHSVASKVQLPPGAPSRLHVELDPDDTLIDPSLTDSITSSPDRHGRRFIKRKVLRKHKGQSLVCDESVYSEDSALSLQITHCIHLTTSVRVATMYKMYNAQWEEESDEDQSSLNSSFWSDKEITEDEEEEAAVVGLEREIDEEDSKPVAEAENSLHEASEEEKHEPSNRGVLQWTHGTDEEDEEDHNSSSDSPAPSFLTSGYGTYRPEEQEGGDSRDDHTVTEFDQDSRGELSEMRDAEEDSRSLCSFGGFDITREPGLYHESRPVSEFASGPEANESCRGDGAAPEEVGHKDLNPEPQEDKSELCERKAELHIKSGAKNVTNATSEGRAEVSLAKGKFSFDEKPLEGGSNHQGLEEENDAEREFEDKVELEDPDDSSINKDIKFIDSKVDFSWTTYEKMCKEWEGNLRQMKEAASCLEDRLADLHISTSTQHDFETEIEDETSQDDTQSSDGITASAFESYIRGLNRRDTDFRPKPKSFIRPVRSQPTIKKSDPVTKYFQYKQLWDMFKQPGEKDRRALRWEIREQLAHQPPPPKPRRVYVPNTYVVPTEKKRSALRWEIRNTLANGLLPHKFNYEF